MAFTGSAVWDLQAAGSDNNGGGFDVGVGGFPTDGAATVANTASPVFSSASYTFVAGDVGHWVWIAGGTNWIPGWYLIASVSGGAATLTAGLKTATLPMGDLNTSVGCATTASPTGATWGLDYSKNTSVKIAFTDMVIGATTTQFTSAANPVGKNFVGNIINVVSGTGFTVQRVAIVSTSGTTATCDKALGTAASTGGTGNLGAALGSPTKATSLLVAGNYLYIGPGTYTTTTTVQVNTSARVLGWSLIRGDKTTTRPLITTSTLTGPLIYLSSGSSTVLLRGLAISTTAASAGIGVQFNSSMTLHMENCTCNGPFSGGWGTLMGSGSNLFARYCAFTNGIGAIVAASLVILDTCCFINNSSSDVSGCTWLDVTNCIHDSTGGPAYFCSGLTFGFIRNTTFNNVNGGSYGTIYVNGNGYNEVRVENCVLWGPAGNTGLHVSAAGTLVSINNAIGNYTVKYSNVTIGDNDVALTANPFTNSSGGDFSLNTAASGGALCKGVGAPGAFNGVASTISTPDLGAVPSTGGSSTPSNYGWAG